MPDVPYVHWVEMHIGPTSAEGVAVMTGRDDLQAAADASLRSCTMNTQGTSARRLVLQVHCYVHQAAAVADAGPHASSRDDRIDSAAAGAA
jgi:hypothetical protein